MSKGAIMSERLVGALVESGLGRQEAHELVRTIAMEAASSGRKMEELAGRNPKVRKRLGGRLKGIFDFDTYVGMAERIVKRAL